MAIIQNKQTSDKIILISIMLASLIALLTINPRTSAFFPSKQNHQLHKLISDAKTTGGIDGRSYWQFREFYSIGNFSFNKNGLTPQDFTTITDKSQIDRVFLIYDSRDLKSFDALVKTSDIKKLADLKSINSKDILYQNHNSIIYNDKDGSTKILFLKSAAEMKKTNGFFGSSEEDNKLIENKYWFNVTSIR